MYRITTDLVRAIIEVKVEGFWSVHQVAAFADDLGLHVARIALTGRRQAVLYDYSAATIQSQDVVGAMQTMARADRFRSRRVALYSAGRLARLQAQRVAAAASGRLAVFDDRQVALDWLATG